MTIFRVEHKNNYTIINNFICKDKLLSWKAKGIYLYAFSRPDDWSFNIADLINQSTDGRDAVRAGLRELQVGGYLVRTQKRDNGQFADAEWVFYETPVIKEKITKAENPIAEKPISGNPPLLSTESLLRTEKQQQPTKLAEKGASAPGAVFSCLKEIGINHDDKLWICSHYAEEIVIEAVKYAIHEDTEIKTSLVQTLKWACKSRPAVPPDKKNLEEENRKIAVSAERRVPKNSIGKISASPNKVELYYEGQSVIIPVIIEYENFKFKDLFDKALEKFHIKLNPIGAL